MKKMLSIVIPVYNEETVLDELLRRTIPAIESFTDDYEIIFVDDGSTDNSLEKLLACRAMNGKIKVLCLSRNFGHQAAYTAGLDHAKGDIIAMMDGDLQDPPELLPEMYRKIRQEGFEVICGRKRRRKGNIVRHFFVSAFHNLFKNIAEVRNIENAGNFSMMTRKAAVALLSMKEKIRYIPGLRAYMGFRQGFVDYVREERYGGRPGMSTGKLIRLASDAIYSFSGFPIRLCLIFGLAGVVIFLTAGIYLLIAGAVNSVIPEWSFVIISICFLGSVQLVFLGILGEYVYRNYKESQNRPVYFVREFYGSPSDEG
ncbi:MAG: glycosyltransferase family 2 protein [Bacteroidales bacterium]